MRLLWDKIVLEGRESEIFETMRIIEPRLTSIAFLSGETDTGFGSCAGIVAALEGEKRRIPLDSLGDGIRRLLALSLSLIQADGGILLIDEIDTGLHYSIMGEMWLLVVSAAMQTNVQVFATTHSSDCVRGLAWLCENHPELGEEISLQKVEPSLAEAVAFDAEQIQIATQQEIEVR